MGWILGQSFGLWMPFCTIEFYLSTSSWDKKGKIILSLFDQKDVMAFPFVCMESAYHFGEMFMILNCVSVF